MRSITFVCLILLPLLSFSQKNKKKNEEESLRTTVHKWYEGSILTTKNEELKGLIKFDDRNGILSYQSGDVQRSFTAKSVTAFEFIDESTKKQRLFYSLEAMDPQTDIMRFSFFELVREFKDFAVLLKVEPLEIKQKATAGPGVGPAGSPSFNTGQTATVLSQEEAIYFMRPSGELTRYLKITTVDNNGLFSLHDGQKTSGEVEEDVLAKFVTEPIYEDLKAYAKENRLKFKRKEDFMKILDYYESLLK